MNNYILLGRLVFCLAFAGSCLCCTVASQESPEDEVAPTESPEPSMALPITQEETETAAVPGGVALEPSVILDEEPNAAEPVPEAAPSDGTTPCQDADLFCEDFESIALGNVPTGAGWVPLDSSCASQKFYTGVSELPESLGSSQRALNARDHAYASCRLTTEVPESDEFWIRSHIYWDENIDFSNKESLSIEMMPAEGVAKDDPSLRFGVRSKEPCTASAGPQITMIGLGGGEVTGCDGDVAMPKGQWVCFEAHVQQGANLVVESFIDGQALSYESVGKDAVEALDLGNIVSAKINHLRLGYFTHNSSGKGDVWIDEFAMATSRLGCSATFTQP